MHPLKASLLSVAIGLLFERSGMREGIADVETEEPLAECSRLRQLEGIKPRFLAMDIYYS